FGAPTSADGVVTVVAANLNSAVSALYSRSASGTWTFGGVTSTNRTNGEIGVAAPLGDGGAALVLGSGGQLRTGTIAGAAFTDTATLADRDFVGYVHDAYPAADSVDLVIRQRA